MVFCFDRVAFHQRRAACHTRRLMTIKATKLLPRMLVKISPHLRTGLHPHPLNGGRRRHRWPCGHGFMHPHRHQPRPQKPHQCIPSRSQSVCTAVSLESMGISPMKEGERDWTRDKGRRRVPNQTPSDVEATWSHVATLPYAPATWLCATLSRSTFLLFTFKSSILPHGDGKTDTESLLRWHPPRPCRRAASALSSKAPPPPRTHAPPSPPLALTSVESVSHKTYHYPDPDFSHTEGGSRLHIYQSFSR
jgi:hypothetical protein